MADARKQVDGQTVLQLKDDIDSGRTGSKTATADPGLSPLGTDDEAAGRPASQAEIAQARRQEKAVGRLATADDAPKTTVPIMLVLGAIAIIAIVIVFAYMLNRG